MLQNNKTCWSFIIKPHNLVTDFLGCPKDHFIILIRLRSSVLFSCVSFPKWVSWGSEEAKGTMPSFLYFLLPHSPKSTNSISSDPRLWHRHPSYFLTTHLWPPELPQGHSQTLPDQVKEPEPHKNMTSALDWSSQCVSAGTWGPRLWPRKQELERVLPPAVCRVVSAKTLNSLRGWISPSFNPIFLINRFLQTNEILPRILM